MTAVIRPAETSPFRDGEFRALWLGRLVSTLGDQLARVAIALIAFGQTRSAGITALTYALTYLPAVLGGPLLGGLADRYPRRAVVISCDLARGALIAVASIPGLPFGALIPLIFAVSLLEPPSDAARSALLANILSGARYMSGISVVQVSAQVASLAGFAVGGALTVVLGARTVLLLDAVSFAFSAVITVLGVRHRAAAGTVPAGAGPGAGSGEAAPGGRTGPRAAMRLIVTDPALFRLAAFALIVCLLVAPESLAAPYTARLGGGAGWTGLFLAAFPVGYTLGGLVLARVSDPGRLLRLIGPSYVLSAVPLICFAAHPGLVVSVALWAVSGALGAVSITVNAVFVRAVPDDSRGAAGALMSSALSGGQGLLMAAAGGIAELLGLPGTIAVFGVVAAVCAASASAGWRPARAAVMAALDKPAEPSETVS